MIDVIIPCFNETQNIIILLDFLSTIEERSEINIIISESPESQERCRNIAKNKGVTYLEAKNKGRAAQMNEASALCLGEVLMFLHADVRPPHNFVTKIKEAIQKGNKAGFFSYRFDNQSLMMRINSKFTKRDGFFAGGGDQCQFVTRDTFERLTGFDESFVIMEDFDFIDRIRKNNIPYAVVDSDATVSARKYENNSWLKINWINLRIFLKYKRGAHPVELSQLYSSLLREKI